MANRRRDVIISLAVPHVVIPVGIYNSESGQYAVRPAVGDTPIDPVAGDARGTTGIPSEEHGI
jgi:hypothetical protein